MGPSPDDKFGGLDEQTTNQHERLLENLDEYGEEDQIVREEIGETMADIHEVKYYKLSREDANDLLSFYITTSAIIEQESVLIINANSFDFGLGEGDSIDFLENDMTQSDREEMLFCLGLIDPGLKGELARTRRRRNEFAHSQYHDEIEDIQQVKNDLDRAERAKNKLQDIGVKVEMDVLGIT